MFTRVSSSAIAFGGGLVLLVALVTPVAAAPPDNPFVGSWESTYLDESNEIGQILGERQIRIQIGGTGHIHGTADPTGICYGQYGELIRSSSFGSGEVTDVDPFVFEGSIDVYCHTALGRKLALENLHVEYEFDADTGTLVARHYPATAQIDCLWRSGSDQSVCPKRPIRIGLNSDLSGVFASLSGPIVAGQEVFWQIVNDNGGIAGRPVELVIRDNGYDVDTHVANYEEMSVVGPDGVFMFSQSVGSPHTAATAGMLVDDDLIAIPLSWYSGWAGPGLGTNVMELQANYCIEAMNGVSYLKDSNDASTIAIISLPGDYGQDGAAGAKIAAAALGLDVVFDGEGTVFPGADLAPVIAGLVAAEPDIVWVTLSPAEFAEILGGSYVQGLRAQWSGNSPTWAPELLLSPIGPIADEVYTHSTYTQLWDVQDGAGMTEMKDAMRTYRPDAPLTDVYVHSWTEGYATLQLLEQAVANGDLTRAGIVAALEDVTVDFKGLAPNQRWGGDPNDYIVRETYIYDVDITNFTPGATVSDVGAGRGFTLLEGPFVSDTAAGYDFAGPCFDIG